MPPSSAWRDEPMARVLEFARGFGPGHAALAMHAAVPLGLTPELLHAIRLNLVQFAPWIAEADLLLSPVCQDLGGGFYQMDREVRELLLDELRCDPAFGEERLLEVAELLLAYVERNLHATGDAETRSFLLAQEWTALAYLQPALAARLIAAALRDGLCSGQNPYALRVANLARALAGPLHAEENVLLYAAGLEKLAAGQVALGVRFLEAIGPADNQHEVHGVALPSAAELRRAMLGDVPTKAIPAAAEEERNTWEFYVVEEGTIIKEGAFQGILELGRQKNQAEAYLQCSKLKDSRTRLTVATYEDRTISREAVTIEPLANGKLLVTNPSQFGLIRLEDRQRIPPQQQVDLEPPLKILFGTRLVQIQPVGMSKPASPVSSSQPQPVGMSKLASPVSSSQLRLIIYCPKAINTGEWHEMPVCVQLHDYYSTAYMPLGTEAFDLWVRERLGTKLDDYHKLEHNCVVNVQTWKELRVVPESSNMVFHPSSYRLKRGEQEMTDRFHLRATAVKGILNVLGTISVFADGTVVASKEWLARVVLVPPPPLPDRFLPEELVASLAVPRQPPLSETPAPVCRLCDSSQIMPESSNEFGFPLCASCVDRIKSQQQSTPGYWIVDRLGRGGKSTVDLALRKMDGMQVAIKMILPEMARSQQELERSIREARILGQQNHPNIVHVLDQGVVEGKFYIEMKYERGSDGDRLLAKEGTIQTCRAVHWICQLLEALAYLHERSFIHRNVSPGNLLITKEREKEVVKLGGFSLAKSFKLDVAQQITIPGDVRGSVAFMAPEQITNFRDAQPPVDQYAAAATLYNLITNQYIYDMPERLQQVLQMMLNDPPVPILKRRPDLPSGLAAAIDRALQREPSERFPNVRAFREAIEPYRT